MSSTSHSSHYQGSARLWRRINLVYLIFVFLPLIWMDGPWALPLALSIVATAVFLPIYWRSHDMQDGRALGAALALIVLGFALTPWNPGGNTFIVYACATLGFSQRWSKAVAVALVASAAYAVLLHVIGMPWQFVIAPVFIGGAVMLGAVLARREMEHSSRLQLSQAEVERMARAAERERIARDLHDLLGHTLSVIAVKSELARKLALRDATLAAQHMAEVESVARDALKQVREAVSGMRAAELASELANARLALLGVGATLDVRIDPLSELDDAVENALAMALREGITNVVRHARAQRVEVDLRRDGEQLLMQVRDDGQGCVGPVGNGLKGMRERLGPLGGSAELFGTAGEGCILTVRLPWVGATQGATA